MYIDQCYMEYRWHYNALYGLISHSRSSDPPNYWYFGMFSEDEYELCADMCLNQEGCEAFTLFLDHVRTNDCYGRGPNTQMVFVGGHNIVSGEKVCEGNI